MTYGGFGASAPIVNPVIVASCLKAYKQQCSNHAKPRAIGIKEEGDVGLTIKGYQLNIHFR
jgi:hypothetical protein